MIENKPQITYGLPLEKIKAVIVEENNESLVEIKENEKIQLLKEHKYLSPYLRQGVISRLEEAASNLPANYKLLIVTAHRPIWMQKELWKRRSKQMAKAHPFMMIFQYKKWKRLVSTYTSPPGGSSHQCGAAVDVTVIDNHGQKLDMGTSLTDFGPIVNTYTNLIDQGQKNNRKILYDAMTKAGFINYPLEWWHYSFGDRMWAAYTNRGKCYYGPIK